MEEKDFIVRCDGFRELNSLKAQLKEKGYTGINNAIMPNIHGMNNVQVCPSLAMYALCSEELLKTKQEQGVKVVDFSEESEPEEI